MSYAFYKIIHVLSIVLFFSLYMSATLKKQNIKKEVILTGIALVFILVSGFGLIAKIGIAHGSSWPGWLKIKLGIWLLVGMFGHIVLKRAVDFAPKAFWILFGILGVASYLANYKPF